MTDRSLLQTELLHISRTNFSESFQLLVHLKVVRLFIESVLRYGLPANYSGVVIKASQVPSSCIVQAHINIARR
jgi:V-type H+-transporting ATPase subunit C